MVYIVKKQNKYFAKSTEYNGVMYHSKKESQMAYELDMRKRAGEIVRWEGQKKISLDFNGYHIANYYIDFVAYLPDGTEEWIEVKSAFTAKFDVWRMKWKMTEALYGNDEKIKLIVVK